MTQNKKINAFEELYSFDEKSACNYIANSGNQPSRNYVKSVVGKNSIIDLGCGNGQEGERYKENFYVGVDISSSLLNLASVRMSDNYFVQANLENLPIKTDSFDCVVLRSILEHQENLSSAIKLIFEGLRVGRRIVFLVWHTPPKNTLWYQSNYVLGHLGRTLPQTSFPYWIFVLLFSFKKSKLSQHEVWEINAKKRLGRISKSRFFNRIWGCRRFYSHRRRFSF